jgi:hypothetical protein
MKRFSVRKDLLFFLLAVLPAVFLAKLILECGVNLIHWDEWKIVSIFQKMCQGRFPLNELAAQHVQHRMLFLRLIILAISGVTRWDVRYEMAFSFFLLCLISFNVYRLSKVTAADKETPAALLLFLANVLIFSPIQAYNVLDGHQICVFLPIACVTTCAVIAYSKHISLQARFIACMAICTVGAFTLAHGMIGWVVILPLLVITGLKDGEDVKKIRALSALWAMFFLLSLLLYFNGYKAPQTGGVPSLGANLRDPAAAAQYFLSLLGAPVFFESLDSAATIGAAMIVIWVAVSYSFIRNRRKDGTGLYQAMGWITLGAYSLFSAAMITAGRAALSARYPMAPMRYMSFSLYFSVSLIYLMAIFLKSFGRGGASRTGSRLFHGIFLLFIPVFLFLQMRTYVEGMLEMYTLKKERSKGKVCLLFMNVINKEDLLDKLVYPDMRLKKEAADYINKRGLINPPLVASDRVDSIKGAPEPGVSYGYFNSLKKNGDDTYTASGWAVLPHRKSAADAVVLAYQAGDEGPRMFDLSCDMGGVGGARRALHHDAAWEITFSTSKLPKGVVTFSAWAFDADRGKVFRLGREHAAEIE